MTQPQTDIVSVAIAITGAFLGSSLAVYVGPYIVIAVAAAVGASCFALPRMEAKEGFRAFLFVVAMTFFACLITVGLAEAAEKYFELEPRWSLAPIALIVGGIGQDWLNVGKWAVSLIGRIFEKRAGG